ncbi:MAG: two-component system sensor histidine kinase/response regulator, partial [Pseudohongiellaceae bacterium]
TLERSMDIASTEMQELNETLRISSATQLSQKRDKLRSVVSAVGDGLCAVDADGRLQLMTPRAAELLRWPQEQAMGSLLFEHITLRASLDEEPERSIHMGDMSALKTVRCESATLTSQGRPGLPVSFVLNPMGERGNLAGAVLLFRDMTEARRLEEQLREAAESAEAASRTKSSFLATMSHEIRTPMNGVIRMNELLLNTALTPDQREFAETVCHSGNALLSLINDILDFSKIEAGQMVLEQVPFDVATTVEDMGVVLAERAQNKDLELVLDISPNLPATLVGDSGRLRQVLLNLVGNSINFTKSGEVRVAVSYSPGAACHGAVTLAVSDTGIGIPQDRQASLFDAFTQADTSTTRRYRGSGLGLAICKRIVEHMGGTLELTSEVGVGSAFSFSIQLKDCEECSSGNGCLDTETPSHTTSTLDAKVLVVDTCTPAGLAAANAIRSLGGQPLLATNVPDALLQLRQAFSDGQPVDVLLIDASGPHRDGPLGLLEELKKDPALSGLPLLVSSTWSTRSSVEETCGERVSRVLAKPLRRAPLALAVAHALSQNPATLSITNTPSRPQHAPCPDNSDKDNSDKETQTQARLLLVEDNPTNQKVALHMLRILGYDAAVASHGQEALEILSRETFDLVLMDCNMPIMDGLEATRRIRAGVTGEPSVPIIAMTANAMQGYREQCIAAGMDEYLVKPVELGALKAMLKSRLGALQPPQS